MSTRRATAPVLAIAIDAAEATLVRLMLARGDLPALGRLLNDGQWGTVRSPAGLGSGAVWPTFATGSPPSTHEICSFWVWDPERMSVGPVPLDPIEPLWTRAAHHGLKACVVDVPFTHPGGVPGGCELIEWGAHDAILRRTSILPPSLGQTVAESRSEHPFSRRPHDAWARSDSAEALARVARDCIEGTRLRGALARRVWTTASPDLMLLAFTEVHRASHMLWPREGDAARPAQLLEDVYRETDAQIGQLLDLAGAVPTIVFSLHGARGSLGVPTVLDELLRAAGLATHRPPRALNVSASRALARRVAPSILKRTYRALIPPSRQVQLAGPPDQLAPYDWERTTAFALPTDQHGWVRLNLRGRERQGIVAPEAYEPTRAVVEATLCEARSEDGDLLVRAVERVGDARQPARRLPDLVVHWNAPRSSTTAGAWRLRATNVSGEHAPDGFFIGRGAPIVQELGGVVRAEDLLRVLLAAAA